MDKCIFSDETTNCKGKCKYGGYCYKHRRNHLIDENNLVNVHLFTGLSKDYLKSDLLYFSKHVLQKNHLKVEKQTLINDIQEFINRYRDYETKIDSIINDFCLGRLPTIDFILLGEMTFILSPISTSKIKLNSLPIEIWL